MALYKAINSAESCNNIQCFGKLEKKTVLGEAEEYYSKENWWAKICETCWALNEATQCTELILSETAVK